MRKVRKYIKSMFLRTIDSGCLTSSVVGKRLCLYTKGDFGQVYIVSFVKVHGKNDVDLR